MRGKRVPRLLQSVLVATCLFLGLWGSAALGADVRVSADVKPGTCPNVLARHSRGLLSVAILGSSTFDVSLVDASSVQLHLADGVGTLGSRVPGVASIGSV